DKKQAPKPPPTLRFPVALDVARLRIGEFHMAALGDKPLRDLQAQVHFEADRGEVHRIDGLSLAWDRLKASGSARIATQSPFALDVQAALSQDTTDPSGWRADAALTGSLTQPQLRATLHAKPAASRPEQSLALSVALRPFEPWPLGDLQASTKALDLSALHSGLPITSLSGDASARTSGMNVPARVSASLSNAAAGRWNEGRLPVRALQ